MSDNYELGTPLASAGGEEDKDADSSIELVLSSDLSALTQGVEGLSLHHTQTRLPAAPGTTLLVCPPACLDHVTPDVHPESAQRIEVLCGVDGILARRSFKNIVRLDAREIEPAALSHVLRVHDWDYVKHLRDRCARGADRLDVDTHLCPVSLAAARVASGAVIAAVDAVVGGAARNAFVAVRPPGHHAGPRGAVARDAGWCGPRACSNGYCLLNHVAVGAAYARQRYADGGGAGAAPPLRRVAIVDFDVHHGNGTEEIVRNLRPREYRLPLPGSWAPRAEEAYKPWLDEDDADHVFFASVHLFDEDDFYPNSGPSTAQEDGADDEAGRYHIHNITLEPVGPDDPAARERLADKRREELRRRASAQFRERVRAQLLPRLDAFRPDILFLSAGFDGHQDDRFHHLHEDDYEWITRELAKIADGRAAGRIVSVLEGGYHTDPAKTSGRAARRKSAEQKKFGALARSCAAHVAVLCEASSGHQKGSA